MQFIRQYRFLLAFMMLLVFCSVMVIRQFAANESRHHQIREAFILLYTKGYSKEAEILYNRLLRDVQTCSDNSLSEDFQRTLVLVDPALNQPANLLWKYHWTVSKELDRRSERSLMRALKIAKEEK